MYHIVLSRARCVSLQTRLGFLSRGNKTEELEPMIKGTILNLVSAVTYAYFLKLQTWILHLEVIINACGLVRTDSVAHMYTIFKTVTLMLYLPIRRLSD